MKKYWSIETATGIVAHEYEAPEHITLENTLPGEISRKEITQEEYQQIIDSQKAES